MSILIALIVGTIIVVYWRVALTLIVIALLALLLLGLAVALDDFQAIQAMATTETPRAGDQPSVKAIPEERG